MHKSQHKLVKKGVESLWSNCVLKVQACAQYVHKAEFMHGLKFQLASFAQVLQVKHTAFINNIFEKLTSLVDYLYPQSTQPIITTKLNKE